GGRDAGLPPFADLVEKVSPSVVNISAVPADPETVAAAGEGGAAPRQVPDWLKKFLEQHGQHGGAPGAADPNAEATPPDGSAADPRADGGGDPGT
ncbi:hypothetical protein, partial [Klebsiella pneumoniae]